MLRQKKLRGQAEEERKNLATKREFSIGRKDISIADIEDAKKKANAHRSSLLTLTEDAHKLEI